jgi:hypothetical protein
MALTAETDLRQDLVMLSRTDPSVPTDVEASEAINALRFLAVDAVEHAGSGHPGTAMALAPLAYRLFTRHLCHDPAKPDWFDRDRLVLSIGHASMLLYGSLYLSGYDITVDDLRNFRQWGSRTRDIRSGESPQASTSRPGRSARVSPTGSASRWPRRCLPDGSISPGYP